MLLGWRRGWKTEVERSTRRRWRRFGPVGISGEEGFKDKLLGLIDKAGAKVRKRGSVAGAAVRAHGENEAERIIRMIGAELGLPKSGQELELLRKGDSRKVLCTALVKARTSDRCE